MQVEQWGEGIANWMTSISEILIVAKALNATFVEPCIHKGRLTYCSETHNVKLSDIFRMDKMKEFHPFIVSHEVFQQNVINDAHDNSSTHFQRICHTAQKYSSKCGEGLLNQHSNISSPSLEAAVASAQNSQRTVLQLTSYWKDGWKNMKFKGRPLIPSKGPTVKMIYNKYFHFTQEIYDFVDMILKEAGIKGENYSVIQWRGEIHSLDYVSCARHIITARAIMQEEEGRRDYKTRGNETAFVLISPLNRNESLTWNTRSKGADAQEALQLLLDDNGFLKLDLLVQKHQDFVRDSIFLAAADLVLAQKAKEFITCDKSCNSICAQCGHQGSFVQLAETLRNARDKNSTSCWPERNAGPRN